MVIDSRAEAGGFSGKPSLRFGGLRQLGPSALVEVQVWLSYNAVKILWTMCFEFAWRCVGLGSVFL